MADWFTRKTWQELYPEAEDLPRYLSAPCRSQFAVTREVIQAVHIDTYKRLHKWLEDNELDGYTGRFMEYIWQYLFLGKGEVCPSISECYCKMYGICIDDTKTLETWQSYKQRATDLDDMTITMGVYEMANKTTGTAAKEDRRITEEILERVRQKAQRYQTSLFERYAIPPLEDG